MRLKTLMRRVQALGEHKAIRPWIKAGTGMVEHDAFVMAGYLAYTAVFAIFPFMIFLTALLGIFGARAGADTLIDQAIRFLPADVGRTLQDPIRQVIAAPHDSLLTIGIAVTAWAASSGFEAIRDALNRAYCASEPRPLWYRRLHSLGMVIATVGLFIVAWLAILLGHVAWDLAARFLPLNEDARWLWDLARYAAAVLLLAIFLLALHQWLPNAKQRWRDLLPGTVLTLVLWIAASVGLSLYMATIGDYNATYGTLGGIAITLLFFYIASVILIFGAELNASLTPIHGDARVKTTSPPSRSQKQPSPEPSASRRA